MLRSDSGTDFRQLHIDGLRHVHKITVHAENQHGDILVDVEQNHNGDVLNVYVTLGKDFPLKAPHITTATGQVLRCSPPGTAWNPQLTVLAEAVQAAFTQLGELWGRIRPPSLMSLKKDLDGLSDDLLRDIVENPTCLETFAYQLPLCKAMREESLNVLRQLETTAEGNRQLIEAVSAARKEVQSGASTLQDNIKALQGQNIKALIDASSKERIIQQFTRASRGIQQKCDDVERQCVSLDPSAAEFRKSVEQLREQFLAQRIQFHDHELRRRAFAASDKQ
jgi:hypothetical protein